MISEVGSFPDPVSDHHGSGFNIVSSLIMIVMEKTREIGILKSMGATSRGIMQIFLFEGIIVGMIGTLLGKCHRIHRLFLQQTFGLLRLPPDVYLIDKLRHEDAGLRFFHDRHRCHHPVPVPRFNPAFKASRLEPVEAYTL